MITYQLVFLDKELHPFPFINNTLQEIDNFTSDFYDKKDLLDIINEAYNQNFTSVIITSKNQLYQTYPIIYEQDTYNIDDLFLKYYDYLHQDLTRIEQSSIRFLRMYELKDYLTGKTKTIDNNTLKKIITVYFQSYHHKRESYFELKDNHIKVKTSSIPNNNSRKTHYQLSSRPLTNQSDELQYYLNNLNEEELYDFLLTRYDLEYLDTSGLYLTDNGKRKVLSHD